MLLIVLLTSLALALGMGIMYFVQSGIEPEQNLSNTSEVEKPAQVIPLRAQAINFPSDIDAACDDEGTASLEKFPYIEIAEELKPRYYITDAFNCAKPIMHLGTQLGGSYLQISDRSGTEFYIVHSDSKSDGQYDMLEAYTNLKKVTINGKEYGVMVLLPGPFGLSSFGYGVLLVTETPVNENDMRIRGIKNVSGDSNFHSSGFYDLIKNHGKLTKDAFGDAFGEGYPEYIIDEAQEDAFYDALWKLLETSEEVNLASQALLNDMALIKIDGSQN